MHTKVRSRRLLRSAAVLFIAALALPMVASATSPTKGAHFSGKTSESPAGSVGFAISRSGTALSGFQFTTLGCLASPGATAIAVKVGTIKLPKSGSFSVSGAKVLNTKHPSSTVTVLIAFTVKVSGKFTTKKAASGTISYSENITTNGEPGPKCSSTLLSFTAKS